MGNTHNEPDPLRSSKASMSNIVLLTSVKVQCLASCIFWLLVKQPEVLREPSPSIEWSRKNEDYWNKTSNSMQQSITKHGRICFPILYWSHLAPITIIYPSLTALLSHRKTHPPWNPIILCITWVAADNSGTPQLTNMTLLTLNPRSSVSIFFLSFTLDFPCYSWFYLNHQISDHLPPLILSRENILLFNQFPSEENRVQKKTFKIYLVEKQWHLILQLPPQGTKLKDILLSH